MNLSHATALVTGGSRGIGYETARELKVRGARVAICGRDEAQVKKAAEELDCLGIRADVGVAADVDRCVAEVLDAYGAFDVLINNAAYGYFAPLAEIDLESFQALLQTNLVGAMLVAQASVRHFLAEGKKGHIVNVGSTAARRGFPRGTPYVATKFALSGMTECWRMELRKSNIRVMQVDPSEVLTGFGGGEPRVSERKLRPAEIAHAICAMLTMDDRGFIPNLEIWATNPD